MMSHKPCSALSFLILPAALTLVFSACSVEVDVSELRFLPPDTTAGAPDVGALEPIACASYVRCLFGLEGVAGEASECLLMVQDDERSYAEALEQCRAERCGAMPQASQVEQASEMVDCILKECTDNLVKCASGGGDGTCMSYAVKWQSQAAGTIICPDSPPELCLIDYLVPTSPEVSAQLTDLIHCIAEIPDGAVEKLATCLAFCR